jgi:hypothetical protein
MLELLLQVMSRLNFGMITLIPEVVGGMDIRNFRPIVMQCHLADLCEG